LIKKWKQIVLSLLLSMGTMLAMPAPVAAEGLGDAGRMYFPNGWSVALNYANPFDVEYTQKVVDWRDSAAEIDEAGTTMIADHASQGFRIIKSYGPGTVVHIDYPWGGSQKYQEVSIYYNAYIVDGYPYLPDGRDAVYGGDSLFMMQTCNSNGTITMSYWTPIWE
jgi:hypothetical protein